MGSTDVYEALKEWKVKTPKTCDSLSAGREAEKIRSICVDKGYWLTVSNLRYQSDSVLIEVELGPRFELASLRAGNLPLWLRSELRYRESTFSGKPFEISKINGLFEQVVYFSENRGYPFASVQLDSVRISGNTIIASLKYWPGPLIVFDTLDVGRQDKVKALWLSAYADMKPGSPFSEKKLQKLPDVIRSTGFMVESGTPTLRFQDLRARPFIDLQMKKASSFDGWLGLFPRQDDGKMLVTGQVEMRLRNLLRSGKSLDLYWQRYQVESQTVRINYAHPAFLRSPVGLDLGFILLKQEEKFLNRELRGAITWRASANTLLWATTKTFVSDLLSNELPGEQLGEVRNGYYGLRITHDKTNDPIYPSRGFQWTTEAQVGPKTYADSAGGEEFRTTQASLFALAKLFVPLKGRWTLYSRLEGAFLVSEQLYQNELFRLGGLQSIRGFNESFFYAERYVLGNFELRFAAEEGTWLGLLVDAGWLKEWSGTQPAWETPLGVGVNLSVQTRSGVLALAIALGKTQGTRFHFDQTKLHFGYQARF